MPLTRPRSPGDALSRRLPYVVLVVEPGTVVGTVEVVVVLVLVEVEVAGRLVVDVVTGAVVVVGRRRTVVVVLGGAVVGAGTMTAGAGDGLGLTHT